MYIKVYYDDSNYKSLIVNNFYIKDNDFKAKCSEYNFAFKSVKEYKFLLNKTFNELSSYLLSNINVPFVYNENYEIDFEYFLKLKGNGINEKFIKKLAYAKSVKIKMNGRQYYNTRVLTKNQIKNIKDSYEYFIALGGKFTN